MVSNKVKKGEFPHPNTIPCSDCGHVWKSGERRHEYDHHNGYDEKHIFDVECVCSSCHNARTYENYYRSREHSTDSVTTSDMVRERLKSLHDTSGLSFRKIQQMDGFRRIPAGTICSVYHGNPVPKKYYPDLGIDDNRVVAVMVMDGGRLPESTQVISAQQCTCSQWFVPNSPRRKRCFVCSPYRKRNKVIQP